MANKRHPLVPARGCGKELSTTEYCKHEMIEAFCADCRGLDLPIEVYLDDDLQHLNGSRNTEDFSKPRWLQTLEDDNNA